MRKSTATVSLSGGLADKLKACAAAGYDGVELFEPDLTVAPESPEEIRALAERLGLRLELFQPFRDFEGVDERLLAQNLARAEAKFALMQRLGIDTILVCSNVATATRPDRAVAVDQLRRLGELAASYGVRVAYEALAWGKYVDDYRESWSIVREVDHAYVGVCLDSFHILSRGHDPAAIEDIPGEKIFFLQIADAPSLDMDVLSWSRHHRLFPGEGAFDLATFVEHVLRAGYEGPLSLEVFNDVFRQTDPQRTAVHSLRSLVYLEDRVAGRTDDTRARASVSALPLVEDPLGITFAEVRAEDTEGVENVLLQLGFRFRGHHRSKPVRLWTQGEARVILNEQTSAGRQPWLAALGLDVEDASSAVDRAHRLMAPRVFRRTHAGEESLEAVEAPDGTEIFLCPPTSGDTPSWAAEFEHGDDASGTPPLVSEIDHVNLAQSWQDFDEAVLFYGGVLSLHSQSASEVAGPQGLIRSQVMRNAVGTVRLALNVAPSGDRDRTSQSGLPQHVAFASSDTAAVARRARDRGLRPLAIPQNYYDDLVARFQLDRGLLEQLRDLNLLYDRSGESEFIHFYTPMLGGVFFEVVERRAFYDGYGAPNAPVRLAAQRRDDLR